MILSSATGLYQEVEQKLEISDGLIKVILLLVAALAVFLVFFQDSKSLRLAAALYWVLP